MRETDRIADELARPIPGAHTIWELVLHVTGWRREVARRLDDVVGAARDAPTGSGVSCYVMLHGLAQHDAYHLGQISLLKRAQAAR
ncbi:MAG TPA: hypothetical protein VFU46_07490 [Gemmatimonadales bacterium]|nr:hypothetical protein [Gemmatimonadales bacterium]